MTEKLSIVLGRHGQVEDLRSGTVRVEGVDLDFIEIKRMPDAYRAMARSQPYDVCEMAPTSYLMAVAAGAPITALALPMTRRFRHAGLLRLRESSIRHPKDLEGRQVGVRAYSVTAAVWTRGILAEEYGLDLDHVTWLTEEDENVESFATPVNVRRVASDTSLAAMMMAGELEVAFGGLAGVGADLDDRLVDLVEDAATKEADWYRRTGIYPLHGVIVVRNDVLARYPDLPRRLYAAFVAAKENYLARVASGAADGAEDKRYRRLAELVGDPLPYGLDSNAKSFEALVRYAHTQLLIPERPAIASVFLDPTAAA
ncbi:ABC transporter substrate-binding protein [Paraburkholderia adhaesiva]|uniref:ABC transporter substrate-binding protein n=1 Tax=Paraburkholderia adhaesiva TaxID=2883244 RepID=UPI001F426486|nr:ABC transporter substrate-binding protein [Paraburkholderia adhaesiva]